MIKQKFFLDFSSKTLRHIFQAIAGIIVARYAGPSIVGVIAYGAAFVGTFNFINGLLAPAHIKIVNESNNEGSCNSTFLILKIVSIVFFCLATFIFYLISKYYFDLDLNSNEKKWIIFISSIVIVCQNLIKIPEGIFVAKMQQARINIPYLLNGLLYNLMRSFLAILGFGAILLSSIPIIVFFILVPFYFYLLKDIPFDKFDLRLAKRYLQLTIPIFIIVFCNAITLNVGRLVLEYFTDTKTLGLFIAGNNIAGILGLVAGTAGSLFYPLFTKAIKNSENRKIVNYIKGYNRIIFNWIFPVIIFLCLFNKQIISTVLGSQYLPASDVFSILILSSFLQIWAIPFANLLFSFDKFNLSAFISISKLIIQLLMVIILVHPDIFNLGIISLPISIISAECFIFIIRYYYSKKLISDLFMAKYILYLFIGLFYYILFSYLLNILSGNHIYIYILMNLFFISIFASMILLGLLNVLDIKNLRRILDFKKMTQYLKKEMNVNSLDTHNG